MKKRQLICLASEQGSSPRVVTAILNTLDVHPDLIDLPRVASGLLRLLSVADVDSPIRFRDCDPRVWREVCDWIVSLRNQPQISLRLGELFWLGNKVPTRNPVVGRHVQRYGFPHAAIWHAPRDTESVRDYDRLIAQLLAAFQRLDSPTQLLDQRYAVFLDLRRLCGMERFSIPPELDVWASPGVFAVQCQGFSSSESKGVTADLFASITRLVRYSYGEQPRKRRGGGGGRRGRVQLEQTELSHFVSEDPRGFLLGDPDDPDQLPGHYNILSIQVPSDPDGELAFNELSPPNEVWALDDESVADRPYVADKLSQQGIEAHIIRDRQFLPFSYGQLTLSELRDLLFGASDLFEACLRELPHTTNSSRLQLRMEAILLLHISLWLGQGSTQVAQMTVVDTEEANVESLALVRGTQGVHRQFSVVARRPDLVGDNRWQPTTGFRVSLSRILLPDLAGSAALIEALLKAFPRSSNRVFEHQTDAIEGEAKTILVILSKGDPRLTLTKTRNYLFLQIIADTHDIAGASMLSGVCVPSAQTPLYYLQLDANYLRRIYVSSLERVLKQVYACAGVAYELVEIQISQKGAVGATHCLLPETIAANAKALASALRQKPVGRLSDMVTWHNCFTLWVVQMFLLSTGCRAIRNPLLHVDELDPGLRMGALSDKDSDDRHMSRLVCMPSMLLRQLDRYFAHCEEVVRQLTGYLPNDVDEVWSRGFFLELGNNGIRRAEIRPASIRQQMVRVEAYTAHPINAYRKFVRTELSERGCPPEAQAAFMGHWLRGEEPQDDYSSFCPTAYADVMQTWVTKLLREFGWTVIGSPWVVR